jgi:hypothetical protein
MLIVQQLHMYVILGSVIFALILLAGIAYMKKLVEVSLMLTVLAIFFVFVLSLFYINSVHNIETFLSDEEFLVLTTVLDAALIIILVLALIKGIPTLPIFAFVSLLLLLATTTVHYFNYYLEEPFLGANVEYFWLYQMLLLAVFIIIMGLSLWYYYGKIPSDVVLDAELSKAEQKLERLESEIRENEAETAEVGETVEDIYKTVSKETSDMGGEMEGS